MRYLTIVLLAAFPLGTGPGIAASADIRPSVSDFARMQEQVDRRVDPCLLPPVLASRQERIFLRVYLRSDGTLARRPVVLQAPTAKVGRLAVLALLRCITKRRPLSLDPRRYALWRQFTIALPPLYSRVTRLSR